MNIDEIKPTVLDILRGIAPEMDPGTLDPDENIRQVLDIDSFDALNFFVRINEAFGISIPESDYGRLNTMSQILGYLSSRLG